MAIILNNGVTNLKNAPGIIEDDFANRPISAVLGTIFISVDTQAIYTYDGTAWILIGSGTGGGGGTNPTSFYVPYNDSGTFQDSFLYNKADEFYLTGIYNNSPVGIKLDFNNLRYELGDFNITNIGTFLRVDDNTTSITTHHNSTDIGLSLSFGQGVFTLGDYNNYYNNIYFKVDLTNEKIITRSAIGFNGLSIDFINDIYQLGDFDYLGNSSILKIDNGNQEIYWISNKEPKFDDNGTGSMITTAPGVPALDYWRVNINGQSYLIPLVYPPL